jgi:hypothetical protein
MNFPLMKKMKLFPLKLIPAFLLFLLPEFLPAQAPAEPFAFVELFTSEGCGSCPPADKLLSGIISDAKENHKNIFCLEYHVDYWNRGGWKDPFSKNQFTLRQNTYSSALRQRELYTPQMIVNGEIEFTGSQADKANAAIDGALKVPAKIALTIEMDSIVTDSVHVHYESSETDKNFSLHFAIAESGLTSKIGKGENAGKTITHDQVVRIFYSLDLKEKNGMASIPLKGLRLNANCKLIAFIQHKQTMKILAATQKAFPGF